MDLKTNMAWFENVKQKFEDLSKKADEAKKAKLEESKRETEALKMTVENEPDAGKEGQKIERLETSPILKENFELSKFEGEKKAPEKGVVRVVGGVDATPFKKTFLPNENYREAVWGIQNALNLGLFDQATVTWIRKNGKAIDKMATYSSLDDLKNSWTEFVGEIGKKEVFGASGVLNMILAFLRCMSAYEPLKGLCKRERVTASELESLHINLPSVNSLSLVLGQSIQKKEERFVQVEGVRSGGGGKEAEETFIPIREDEEETFVPIREDEEDTFVPVREDDEETTNVSIEEDKEDTEVPIEENKEDTEVPIEQNKEDTEVPIEQNKEDTEVPIEQNKEDTEVPIEQNKEDTEVPIEENKEKTEVPIEENEDETVEPNTSEEPNMSTPLTSEEQNMSIPEVEHSEKTEALEREEYSEETPPTQEDLPDTQVVIEVLDEVSQNITDMNTIESQVMETQFNYLHERYVALTSIELTMTPVNSRLFLESKAYIAYKNEIDKNISNINNYFDVLIRKINELLPENTYLCDKVEAIKNKIISKYEELKSIKSISEGNFENKMQKIQDELQNFERLKDEL